MWIPEQLAALEQRVTAIEQARAAQAQARAESAAESAAEFVAELKAGQEKQDRINAMMVAKSAEMNREALLRHAQNEFDRLPPWKKALSRFWFERKISRLRGRGGRL